MSDLINNDIIVILAFIAFHAYQNLNFENFSLMGRFRVTGHIYVIYIYIYIYVTKNEKIALMVKLSLIQNTQKNAINMTMAKKIFLHI